MGRENRTAYLGSVQRQMGIDALGYSPEQKDMYMHALGQPQGMILVTGPTGSGKTVSLYTGLNILNTTEINISTAEDPVEINLEGINQVHVNPKVGLTFAEALRAFLRQDPDVVMVGEIRDLETAEIGIKAAQTGHLVLDPAHQLGSGNPDPPQKHGGACLQHRDLGQFDYRPASCPAFMQTLQKAGRRATRSA